MSLKSDNSFHTQLNRLLLVIAVSETILLLGLAIWLAFLYLSLAKLTEPVLAWTIGLVCVVGATAAVWQLFRAAWRRRFRFSLRTLLIGMLVLSVLSAIATSYVSRLREQHAARSAVSYIQSRGGSIVTGSPTDATAEERLDWTDSRNTTSVSFSGTTLVESDFQQLAKAPNLTSLTVKDAPVDVENLLLLRRLPKLQFLVFENTGANDAELNKIEQMNPRWRVFASSNELKQWSLKRVREMHGNEEN